MAVHKKLHNPGKPQIQVSLEELFDKTTYLRHENIGKYLVNGLGGTAENLVIADNTGAIVSAAKAAIVAKEPYIVIAHGTGSLVSEIGFPGLVIINKTKNIAFAPSASEALVDSGASNAELVNMLASRGFGGLEFLSAIPGSVGGAVATSASWEGKTILSYVKELIMFVADADGGKVVSFKASELPKHSSQLMFPKAENSPIILSVRLQLAQITQTEIMRRLSLIRKLGNAEDRAISMLGYYISPPLANQAISQKELNALGFARGVRISRNNPSLLEFRSDNTPEQLRDAVRSIVSLLRGSGAVLDERLSYLGYWPSKEESGTTTNTESF